MVVEVISSRTDSSSRIWAINDPVDFDRAPFLIPSGRGQTRARKYAGRRASHHVRNMHPQHAHDEFKHDGDHHTAKQHPQRGLRLGRHHPASYTCMEKTMPESASTLATSATSIMSL